MQSLRISGETTRPTCGFFVRLAEQENADAQIRLGNMYLDGDGVPQDFAEAAQWYRKAAERGLAEAQYKLGFMYYAGIGVPKKFCRSGEMVSQGGRTGIRLGAGLPRVQVRSRSGRS